MKVEKRRRGIIDLLANEKRAVSGGELSKIFGVSRQIIVQDISALKKSGFDIVATHTGYVIRTSPFHERVVEVFHSAEQTEEELSLILNMGGTIVDVFVWHKVYGKIKARLNIADKETLAQFLEGIRSGKSGELLNITGGYHYHTVRADSEEALDRIAAALAEKGFLASEG
ncbi:MAG: transcription repressor NadR [Clostridia bacterium]|nr:transcription repressor NadR [Clostridia bacterium]